MQEVKQRNVTGEYSRIVEEDISYVKEICEAIGDSPAECDVDEVVRKLS